MGTWGGAVDAGEDPADAVLREVCEEAGAGCDAGDVKLVPLYVFRKGSFAYHNFMASVPHEFTPKLNWETDDFMWTTLDSMPSPLHFGLAALLKDPVSLRKIKKVAR